MIDLLNISFIVLAGILTLVFFGVLLKFLFLLSNKDNRKSLIQWGITLVILVVSLLSLTILTKMYARHIFIDNILKILHNNKIEPTVFINNHKCNLSPSSFLKELSNIKDGLPDYTTNQEEIICVITHPDYKTLKFMLKQHRRKKQVYLLYNLDLVGIKAKSFGLTSTSYISTCLKKSTPEGGK